MRRRTLLPALLASCRAYIPALPTNDTTSVSSSNDFIQLSWQLSGSGSQGVFRDKVSRSLIADNSSQVGQNYAARGALVHFSETNMTQQPASSPWVAFINCDRNATNAPQDTDVFTSVRDRGAVAALLYSFTAAGCSFNTEYLDNYEKVIDVYSTSSLQSARLIDSQFVNVGSAAYWFDSTSLNSSYTSIWSQLNDTLALLSTATPTATDTDAVKPTSFEVPDASLASTIEPDAESTAATDATDEFPNYFTKRAYRTVFEKRQATTTAAPTRTSSDASTRPTTSLPAYLIAVLANADAVFQTNSTASGTPGNDSGSNDNGNGGGAMTGLAMIVLYAITAVVTLMFLVVIISGAIKAIRHPERYGPRARSGRQAAQTRARGLTRAILDTFPVVKFGHSAPETSEAPEAVAPEAKAARESTQMQMQDLEAGRGLPPPVVLPAMNMEESGEAATPAVASDKSGPTTTEAAVDPLAVDVDHQHTCPICLQDFEAGEDLRVLPCDARHRFHRDCIDPWLLDVSSACPLCRLDLGQTVQGEQETSDHDSAEEAAAAAHSRASVGGYAARVRRILQAGSSTAGPADSEPASPTDAITPATPAEPAQATHSRFRRYLVQVREATSSQRRAQQERRASGSSESA